MSNLTFYTNAQSRGRIVHWMMEELGEPYVTEWIDFGEPMKSPQYLAINPMGKVPALRHGDAVVTEAPAICAYLAASFPEKGLMPAPGGPALADYYRWIFFAAGPMEQMVSAKAMGWQVPEGRQATVGFGSETSVLTTAELALAKGPYLCGDQFTAADVYFGSALSWGMMFETIEKRPSFEEYTQRVTSRPAFIKALQINEDRIKELESSA